MSKKMILAGLMALMLLMTGCALIEKDEAVDAQSIIITLGDTTITKGEVQNMIELYYGDLTGADASYRKSAQESVVQYLIQQEVLNQKIKDEKLDQLTAEEEAQVKAEAEELYQSEWDFAKQTLFPEGSDDEAQMNAQIESYLAEIGATQAYYEEYLRNVKIDERLVSLAVPAVQLDQAELLNELEYLVEYDMVEFMDDPAAYGERVNSGASAYYTPGGYRYVKMLKIDFLDEDMAKIEELSEKLLSGEGDAQSLAAQVEAAQEEAYGNIQARADEVSGKIQAGADFDQLMTEYNDDYQALLSPIKEKGYAVCEGSAAMDPAAVTAGMALTTAGEVSQTVRLADGLAILRYEGDIPEGAVTLDQVQEDLENTLIEAKQEQMLQTVVQQWVDESGAKVDYDALNR